MLVVVLCLLAGRGMWRAYTNSVDLKMIYACASTWLEGGDPYDSRVILDVFHRRGGDPDREFDPDRFVSLYPPATYALMSPLAYVSWSVARPLWLFLNLALVGATLVAAARFLGWRRPQRLALLIGLVLLFGPLQTSISQGQLTVLCLAAVMWSLLWLREGQMVLPGLALGLAAALKPQTAGLFVLMLPLLGRWRAFAVATAAGLFALGIGVARLEALGHSHWLAQLLENVTQYQPWGERGAMRTNEWWYLVLALHTPFYSFISNPAVVSCLVYVVCASALVAIAARARIRPIAAPDPAAALVVPAAIAALTLLPMYHRFYDAIVLIIPLLWLLARLSAGLRSWKEIVVGLGLLVFLLPNSVAMIGVAVNPRLPQWLTDHRAWEFVVMSHQVWAVVAVLFGLLAALWEQPRGAIPQQTSPPGAGTPADAAGREKRGGTAGETDAPHRAAQPL